MRRMFFSLRLCLGLALMVPSLALSASCDWGTNCSGSAGRVAGADWNAAMNLHNAWTDKSIATNAISIDGDGKYRITSCGGNLQTITNASATSGDVIWLTIDGSGCTSMTIEDTTGNIELPGNANITVTSVEQIIPLIYNGTNYVAQLAGYVHLGGGQTIAGTLTVNSTVTATSFLSTPVDDGKTCWNPATAGETTWCVGPNHDSAGDNDDLLEMRTSSTPGTGVAWTVHPTTQAIVHYGSVTIGDGTAASETLTGDVSGTDTVVTLGNGVVNVSTGTLQQAGSDVLSTDNTKTLTNKTYDAEGSGNSLTTVEKLWFDGAGCVGATATNNWDDAGTGDTAPTAACNDTGSIQRPSADFSGSAVNSFERTFRLASDWAGAIDLIILHVAVAASPTGNVEWDVSTVCRASGETWDAAFNTAQTITDAVAAQNTLNEATQTSLTTTGCAAGEYLTLKISRDGTNDTNNDLAKMLGAEITLRRAQ